jgi:hypothetical protein
MLDRPNSLKAYGETMLRLAPKVEPKYNTEQAARCIDAAIRWTQDEQGKDDKNYKLDVLLSFLREAQASLPAALPPQPGVSGDEKG